MRILVLPGDGIGPEITAVAVQVLDAAAKRHGLLIDFENDVVGYDSIARHKTTVRNELLDRSRACGAVLLGPTSSAEHEKRGYSGVNKVFRIGLDLFANIRPCRTFKGIKAIAGQFDLTVVRENTEGFYADRNVTSGGSEMLVTPDVVVSLRRITRGCCERIARSAFDLAMTRRKKVTIVHKASVLKIGDGMFVEECHKAAKGYPDVIVDEVLIDAAMALVVRDPTRFDVMVTTNMFGDILSDLTAELTGSLGLGPSLNAGEGVALGQPGHGSAPDIAGTGKANPMAQVLSAAMLVSWHGQRSQQSKFISAANSIEQAVSDCIAEGQTTPDLGGTLKTQEVADAISKRLAA